MVVSHLHKSNQEINSLSVACSSESTMSGHGTAKSRKHPYSERSFCELSGGELEEECVRGWVREHTRVKSKIGGVKRRLIRFIPLVLNISSGKVSQGERIQVVLFLFSLSPEGLC